MKYVIAALCLAFAATSAVAQDKKDKPSAAQKEQQDRMKDCNKQASDKKMKGDDRQKFMSSCLKDGGGNEPTAAQKKQQERMKMCNEKAGDKKGDERQKFMSSCLKSK